MRLFWNKGCERRLCWRKVTKQLVIGDYPGFEPERINYCEYHHKIACEVLAEMSKEAHIDYTPPIKKDR